MIGGLTSSLALAQRTADAAGARMAKVSRQMATGKEVASARDDGARYAQAVALKSQQAAIKGRATLLSIYEASSAEQDVENYQAIENYAKGRDLVLQAKQYAIGSTQRAAIQAEYARVINAIDTSVAESGQITSGYGQFSGLWGIQGTGADSVINGKPLFVTAGAGNGHQAWSYMFSAGGVQLRNLNLSTMSGADLDAAIAAYDTIADSPNDFAQYFAQRTAQDKAWYEDIRLRDAKDIDRLDLAIGSLTDADMGKASTARAQAETRQQLALDTISRAISAYGNFAGGLLGNVQRTQRGVLA
jgi:flagellin